MLRKLWERNLSVIPVGTNKAPLIKGWSEFCDRLPSNEEISQWEAAFIGCGVGLACGRASNILAIDIDIDSADFKKHFPLSPIIKVGMPGKETRLFQFNPDIETQHLSGWDILSTGAQTVLPPSIHPGTKKPYYYVTPDTLENFSVSDLPTISLVQMEAIKASLGVASGSAPAVGGDVELSGSYINDTGDRCPHGSQSRLKKLCAILIDNGNGPEKIVSELIKYDNEHHTPPYFTDKTRPDCKADAYTNALGFYASINRTINIKRLRAGLEPQTPRGDLVIELVERKKEEQQKYPEMSGLLEMFRHGILHKSRRNQDALAVGGALALGSVLCANRFKNDGALLSTRLYVLNIGETGIGKDAPYRFVSSVLGHPELSKDKLIGISNYSSKAAMVELLSKQRVRLDMRDEFKDTFIAMANIKGASGNEISSFLNEHYTHSGWFPGHYTKSDKWVGACYDPSISILASIQPQELAANATASNFSDGFMGRFIYFVGKRNAEYLGRQGNSLDSVVQYCVNEILNTLPPLKYSEFDMVGNVIEPHLGRPICEELVFDAAYLRTREQFDKDLAEREDKLSLLGQENERALLTRQNMFVERLSFIIAACSGSRTVTVDHFDLAVKIVTVSQHYSNSFVSSSGLPQFEAAIKKILSHIESCGHIKKSEVHRLLRLKKSQVNEILDEMVERDLIAQGVATASGACKPTTVYVSAKASSAQQL